MKNWKKNFNDLLFQVNPIQSNYSHKLKKFIGKVELLPSEEQIDLAYKLKFKNLPKLLYKYKDFDKKGYSLDSLRNNSLRLTKPINFNDPYDARTFNYDSSEASFKSDLNANIYRVGCLSEINDSILMWSHYANNHSGFCIEYDFEGIPQTDIIANSLFPVFYSNLNALQKIDALSGMKYYQLFAVLRKSIEWKYEVEWRIVIPVYENLEFIQMPKIKSVYLGCNISESNKSKILQLSKNQFEVYQAFKNSSETSLTFKLLS